MGCLYLMGLNLSNQPIAQELGLNKDDVQNMSAQRRDGVVARRPELSLSGTVECDEVYVVAAIKDLPKTTVLEQVDQFIERFQVADDTAAVTGQLVKLMGEFPVGGKQVHDANIVATMQAYGIPALLTHNTKDFERFGEVIRIEGI